MTIVGHLVNDPDALELYFDEDGPVRSMMFFIENHCDEVFKRQLSIIPQAFSLPKEGGGYIEAGVIANVMDVTSEEPVLHIVLEALVQEDEEKVTLQ